MTSFTSCRLGSDPIARHPRLYPDQQMTQALVFLELKNMLEIVQ